MFLPRPINYPLDKLMYYYTYSDDYKMKKKFFFFWFSLFGRGRRTKNAYNELAFMYIYNVKLWFVSKGFNKNKKENVEMNEKKKIFLPFLVIWWSTQKNWKLFERKSEVKIKFKIKAQKSITILSRWVVKTTEKIKIIWVISSYTIGK